MYWSAGLFALYVLECIEVQVCLLSMYWIVLMCTSAFYLVTLCTSLVAPCAAVFHKLYINLCWVGQDFENFCFFSISFMWMIMYILEVYHIWKIHVSQEDYKLFGKLWDFWILWSYLVHVRGAEACLLHNLFLGLSDCLCDVPKGSWELYTVFICKPYFCKSIVLVSKHLQKGIIIHCAVNCKHLTLFH